VFTRTNAGEKKIYVDGLLRSTGYHAGDFSNWDPTWGLALANEFVDSRTWLGTLHLAAVYCRALDEIEVARNFVAGP
jgi:hypothetical protein